MHGDGNGGHAYKKRADDNEHTRDEDKDDGRACIQSSNVQ